MVADVFVFVETLRFVGALGTLSVTNDTTALEDTPSLFVAYSDTT
jgi:hypothetical protein